MEEVRGKPFLTKNKIEKGQRYEEHGVCERAVIQLMKMWGMVWDQD